MVERRKAAGCVLEIITVISMTERKAVQPTAQRESYHLESTSESFSGLLNDPEERALRPQVSKNNSFAHKGGNYVL